MSALVSLADTLLGPNWRLKESIRADLFDKQLWLYDHPAKRKAAHPGRRAGKSEGLPRFASMDALDCRFNEVVIMGAETKAKAEALYRPQLVRLTKEKRLPFEWNGQAKAFLNVSGDGSGIYLWGMKDRDAADMLRGFKVRSAYFDEVATYALRLKYLANEAIGPALMDLDGTLVFAGTPSITRAGDWFDICEGFEPGWSVFHWTALDNPKLGRDPVEALRQIRELRKLDESDATYRREYMGRFVNDPESTVVRYVSTRDDVQALPADYSLAWTHVFGVDYGYNDAFAVVVLAVDPYSLDKYVVHAEKEARLTYDQAADMLARLLEQFGATLVVCDPAGGGKPFYETFNRRYGEKLGVNVRSAHKVAGSLVESYRFQNTELTNTRLKLLQPAAAALAAEWTVLPWADQWRTEPDDAYEQDCTDACRYALMETITWQPKQRPAPATDAERLERELRKSIERQAAQDRSPMGSLRNRWG